MGPSRSPWAMVLGASHLPRRGPARDVTLGLGPPESALEPVPDGGNADFRHHIGTLGKAGAVPGGRAPRGHPPCREVVLGSSGFRHSGESTARFRAPRASLKFVPKPTAWANNRGENPRFSPTGALIAMRPGVQHDGR